MSKRRSMLEIYLDLLKNIEKGVRKPTPLMFKTNISWPLLKDLLKRMTDLGLIVKEDRGKSSIYRITDKGRIILEKYDSIKKEVNLPE